MESVCDEIIKEQVRKVCLEHDDKAVHPEF